MGEERTFSAKQVATRIGTDAKQLRKFFRDPDSGYDAVGQGGRYDFPEGDLEKIKAAFDTWSAGKTRRNRPTRAARAASAVPIVVSRKGRIKPAEGMHGNALDEDDLHTRTTLGIGGRVEKHNLTVNNYGRIIEKTGVAVMDHEDENPYPGPHGEEQAIIDHLETRGDDDFDSDYDFED